MKKYHARIERGESCEFDFTSDDIEDDDTPEAAAVELLAMDFAGPDPFEEDFEHVTVTEVS